MKIVADKNIPFLKGVAEHFGSVEYLAGADFSHNSIKDADTLIVRTVTHFDESILGGSNVKLICSATIGYDHIDTAYCDTHGIAWTNAPGCNSGSVQQYIVSSLVTIARKKEFSLAGKTIGIVGVGNVGSKVAAACQLLGMRVLLNDPPRESKEGSIGFVSLDTIKQEADIITFHTPLTKSGEYKTYHLGDEAFFSSLDQKPIIINSARGAIIDTYAIKKAISVGQISAAVIDCWESEPDIDLDYMNMVDIATPHIAGYSADGKANATRMSLEAVANFYRLDKAPIGSIKAPNVPNPIVDLDHFPLDKRIDDAILTTYNPMDDCSRLITSPTSFKQLRNEYPLRREYGAYVVRGASSEEYQVLGGLGFQMF